MNILKNFIFGIVMGIANIIPGVSGGTMAVILNFYDKLMACITLDFKVIRRNLDFLIPLAIGIIVAVLGLSNLMKYLLNNYTTQTYFAFIGIVFGSFHLIYSKSMENKFEVKNLIFFLITIILMVWLTLKNGSINEDASMVIKYTSLNFESFIVLFLTLSLASITMIIPGISGALVLIILGMYGTVIGYVIADFNIPLLIPSGLGVVFGIVGGASLVRFLLSKYHQATYLAILGLLVGSSFQLYTNSNLYFGFNLETFSSIFIMIISFTSVEFFSLKELK